MERSEGLLAAVLTVVNTTSVSPHVRLAGALYAKNLIRDAWPGVREGAEGESAQPKRGFYLPERDLVSALLGSSHATQDHMCACVCVKPTCQSDQRSLGMLSRRASSWPATCTWARDTGRNFEGLRIQTKPCTGCILALAWM
jgi:hypothetical protein